MSKCPVLFLHQLFLHHSKSCCVTLLLVKYKVRVHICKLGILISAKKQTHWSNCSFLLFLSNKKIKKWWSVHDYSLCRKEWPVDDSASPQHYSPTRGSWLCFASSFNEFSSALDLVVSSADWQVDTFFIYLFFCQADRPNITSIMSVSLLSSQVWSLISVLRWLWRQ